MNKPDGNQVLCTLGLTADPLTREKLDQQMLAAGPAEGRIYTLGCTCGAYDMRLGYIDGIIYGYCPSCGTVPWKIEMSLPSPEPAPINPTHIERTN